MPKIAHNNEENQIVNDNSVGKAVSEQIVWIAIEDIDCSERLRPIDSVYADALARSIIKDGLLHPIDVCRLPNQKSGKPYRLVAGGHRMAGIKRLQELVHIANTTETILPQMIAEFQAQKSRYQEFIKDGRLSIPAFIRSHDADARRSREIAENIFNAPLKPYERAKFIAELVEIERRKIGLMPGEAGQKAGAKSRWENAAKKDIAKGAKDANDIMSLAYGFTSNVAAKLNMTARTIQRDLELLRIPESLLNELEGSPILENAAALRMISKMSPEARPNIIADLKEGKAFAEAVAPYAPKPAIVTNAQAEEEAFFKAFKKLPLHVQDAYLGRIAPLVENRWDISRKGAKNG